MQSDRGKVVLLSALVTLSACGGEPSSPASPPVATLEVTPATVDLRVGENTQLRATLRDAAGAALTGRALAWTSSEVSVATVAADGVVIAVSRGSTRITATSEGASGSADVSVRPVDFRPAGEATLRGAVTFAEVNVPTGVTVRVEGDVTIDVLGAFTMNGTLVGDCVAIGVRARGDVAVGGTIRNACTEASRSRKDVRIIGNGRLALGPGLIESSGTVFISNDSTVSDFASLPSADGRLASTRLLRSAAIHECDLNGFVSKPSPVKAPNGTSGPTGMDGADGADLFIYCNGDMSVQDTYLQAQDGGDGGAGVHTSQTAALATGGRGGKGGFVSAGGFGRTTTFHDANNSFISGHGGNGGRADATGLIDNVSPQGASASATGGEGGRPGNVSLGLNAVDLRSGALTLVTGRGGSGGPATAEGADGVDAALRNGNGQHGGDATATAGVAAAGTTVDNKLLTLPNVTVRAGNGGDGASAIADAGDGGNGSEQSPDGADGGLPEARGSDGGFGAVSDPMSRFLSNGGAGGDASFFGGNGGDGARRCPPRQIGRGGDGGRGGDVYGAAGKKGIPNGIEDGTITIADAANGGDGGDGSGPGAQGRAGRDSVTRIGQQAAVTNSFEDGDSGTLCPGATFDVDISPPSAMIDVGQTFVFMCTVRDTRTGNVVTPPLQWTSSNTAVATVVTGVVLGGSPGTTFIACRLASGESASAQVTVRGPTNPMCDPLQTPQANAARQVIGVLFPLFGPGGFCSLATMNLFTGPTKHSSDAEAPRPRVMDHTSFNVVGAVTATDVDAAAAVAFNQRFPCGTHATGRTLCPRTSSFAPGKYIVVFGVMNGSFPATDLTSAYQYGFVFDRDNTTGNNFVASSSFPNDFFQGTDRWYTLVGTPQQGWQLVAFSAFGTTVQQSTTNARLIVSGATSVLIVPSTELVVPNPRTRFTAFRHDGRSGLNGAPWSGDVQRPVDMPLYDIPFSPLPEIDLVPTVRRSRR